MSHWTVSEIVLQATYFGHAADEAVVECASVFDVNPIYTLQMGADGSGQRSMSSPAKLICRGVNVAAIESLVWKPTSVSFNTTSGESIQVQVSTGTSLSGDAYEFIKAG